MRFYLSRRWAIFIIAGLNFMLSQFYRSSVAVISPNLVADLGLDANGLSLISASFFYTFAIMQIPIAIYLDHIGPRIAMTALTLIAVVGVVVFATGESLTALVVGRLLIGAGMACNLMGLLKLITLWFGPSRFATLAALVLSIGTAGNIVSATPLVLMVDAVGWRTAFLLFACLNFLVLVLFLVIVRDRPESSTASLEITANDRQNPLAGIRELILHRDFWIISFGSFSRYGVFAAVQALWAGPYLMTALGISAVATGNLLFLTSIGLIVGSPFFGYVSDAILISRKIPIYLGLLGKIVILVILARLRPGASMALLALLFFGLGFLTSSGQIMYAHIKERMPINRAGAAMTGINFFTMVGVAFFLQILGNAMQYFFPNETFGSTAFEYAFYFCAASLALAGVLYSLTKETLPIKPLS